MPSFDFSALAPELILLVTGLAVILLDITTQDKRSLPVVTGAGLIIALALTLSGPASSATTVAGGVLTADGITFVFRLLLAGSTLLVVSGTAGYVAEHVSADRGEFYALMLFACASMMFLSAATELITTYIALETSGIALYALAGFLRDRRSSEAGIKFLVLGGVSSAVLLYGMVLFFGLTGSTLYSEIGPALAQTFQVNQLPIMLSVVLMVAGFGFKMAAFPFQMWVPDVYEGAPIPVTMFLSVVSKAAGFAVVLRLFHTVLGAPPVAAEWVYIFAALAALTMTLGNVVALQQRNIKRLMGYSSIAQAGYLMVGLAVITTSNGVPMGVSAVVFFLLSYAATNLAAFAAIIALTEGLGSEEIADFSGVAQRSPLLAFCLALALLSLTGIPPTAGFFAKLTVFGVALGQGLLWLVLVGVINSVISAYYYIGIVKSMYVGAPKSAAAIPAPAALTAVLVVATAGTFLVGVFPAQPLALALAASSWLH